MLLLATLSIALMICDHRFYPLRKIRAELTLFVVPLQYIVNAPVQLYVLAKSHMASHQKLLQYNRSLLTTQLLLKARVQKLMALEMENKQLRALLKSAPKASDKVLAVQLLAVAASPFARHIIIDKGKKHGVYLGQPVLDAAGIMGQVIEVDPLTARVMLITDARSAVPVLVNRNGVRAILVGNSFNDNLSLIHVPQTVDVHVGDMLVTSGLGQRYPQGYPVGKISKIVRDPNSPFLNIVVAPSSDIHRSQHLLLAWPSWHDSARQKELASTLERHQHLPHKPQAKKHKDKAA